MKTLSRRMRARAWLAIALSYLLGLNVFVLTLAPAQADRLGVICSQDRSAPDQRDHHKKTHPCCTAARCCGGALHTGLPPALAILTQRIASDLRHAPVGKAGPSAWAPFLAFNARGPPRSV